MKEWPFEAALRGEASNYLMPRWLMTVVVSDEEKASQEASGGDQGDERKRIVAEVSLQIKPTSKPKYRRIFGMSLAGARLLAGWCPACRRREPDLLLSHGTGEGVPRHCLPCWGRREGVSQATETARDRVPTWGALADRLVVVTKPL
jgi:hypothetical protein